MLPCLLWVVSKPCPARVLCMRAGRSDATSSTWAATKPLFPFGPHPLARYAGWYVGDLSANLSPASHTLDVSFGAPSVAFGNSPNPARVPTYSVWYRSKSLTSAARMSCVDHLRRGSTTSGVYSVDRGAGPVNVYCDMALSGGGWDLVVSSASTRATFFIDQVRLRTSLCVQLGLQYYYHMCHVQKATK